MMKAPSNEEELRIFLKKIEIEMRLKMHKREQIRKEKVVRILKMHLIEFTKEFEIDTSTLEILIEKKINEITYNDVDGIIERLEDFAPSFAKMLKSKIEKMKKEEQK